MVTCQSANQLKTPAKVSWAFKMVSQFSSLGYTIMGKTADLTVVQKTRDFFNLFVFQRRIFSQKLHVFDRKYNKKVISEILIKNMFKEIFFYIQDINCSVFYFILLLNFNQFWNFFYFCSLFIFLSSI